MSRRTRVSKTLYCWGELHHRWVVAVGWKLQNSSPTELAYGDEFRKIELCDLKIYILNKFCKTLPTQSEGSFIFHQSGGGGGGMKKICFYKEGGVSDGFIQMQTACQNAEKQVFLTFRKLRFFWGSMPQDPYFIMHQTTILPHCTIQKNYKSIHVPNWTFH